MFSGIRNYRNHRGGRRVIGYKILAFFPKVFKIESGSRDRAVAGSCAAWNTEHLFRQAICTLR